MSNEIRTAFCTYALMVLLGMMLLLTPLSYGDTKNGTPEDSVAGEQVPQPDFTLDQWGKEYRKLRATYHSGLLPLGVAFVGLATRFLRTKAGWQLVDRLPPRRRWWVPAGLGLVLVACEVLLGVHLLRAVSDGVMSFLAAIGFHSSIVRDAFGVPSPENK